MTMIIDGSNGVTFPNSTVQASAGSVLQVVNATLSGGVTSTTSTWVDTGLTATITPKFSTSKILVTVHCAGIGKDGNANTKLQLLRNSTAIVLIEDGAGYNASSAANYVAGSGTTYLDSPATTSATTYKVQFASQTNVANAFLNCYYSSNTVKSTITLMEISA